jgi:cell division protein FtsL
MSRLSATLMLTLSVAAFLAALSVVAWRQGPAREVMADRERVREAIALESEVRAELIDEIVHLESRRRVVRDARERLGMHIPDTRDLVLLPVGDR